MFEGVQEASKSLLQPFEGVLEAFEGVLEAFEDVLEAFQGVQEAIQGVLCSLCTITYATTTIELCVDALRREKLSSYYVRTTNMKRELFIVSYCTLSVLSNYFYS